MRVAIFCAQSLLGQTVSASSKRVRHALVDEVVERVEEAILLEPRASAEARKMGLVPCAVQPPRSRHRDRHAVAEEPH